MRRMLSFDGRNARRAWPVLGEYIPLPARAKRALEEACTLQDRLS